MGAPTQSLCLPAARLLGREVYLVRQGAVGLEPRHLTVRTPEEVVWDVEDELNYPLGPNISEVLEELVAQLDERYET